LLQDKNSKSKNEILLSNSNKSI